MRWIVVLHHDDPCAYVHEMVSCGPFRSEGAAERRASVIRKLAAQYEDPEGVTGPDNALHVTIEPLLRGKTSAVDVLGVMYQSIPAEATYPDFWKEGRDE